MEAKSNKRNARVRKSTKQYVTRDGDRLSIPVVPGNTPRMSGKRTGDDDLFLAANNGKLSILQQA